MATSSLFRGRPLQLPPRPVFTSNDAYAFAIILTTLFFLRFILLYVHQFGGDTSTVASSGRRRRRRHNCRSPCGGVDPTTVQSLPVFSHHGDTKEQVECAICLDELQKGETVKMIPYCKHLFHPECIDTWLVSHLTCPICRCTRFCEAERGGSIRIHDHHQGGSTVENGGELGSHNEGRISRSRSSSDSSLGLGLGDTVMVGLWRTLSC